VDAGSEGSGAADTGNDDDVTPPGNDSSRAGRPGRTASRAGTGGSNTAGSGVADAGAAIGTSNEPGCDPVHPQQPRPPLTACAAGQACLFHDEAAVTGSAVLTNCATAGSTAPDASCKQDADCTAGHICDSVFLRCVQLCGTTQDCDDSTCPGVVLRTIGTTGLPIGICGGLEL
jgi:hypothetical protein